MKDSRTDSGKGSDALSFEEMATRLRHFEYMTSQIPTAMWVTDAELRFVEGFGASLGVSFDIDLYRGRSLYEVFGERLEGRSPVAAHEAALRGESGHFLHEFGGRTLEVTVQPKLDGAGHVIGCLGHAIDVSIRLAIEEALRLSEERFELVARAVNDAIWDWDIASGKVWRGDGFSLIFGHGSEDQITTQQWYEEQIHPEDRQRVMRSLQDAVDGAIGPMWSAEYRFQRSDGSYAHVFDRGQVMRNAEGVAVRMAGGMQDISDRKRLELDLQHQTYHDETSGLPNRVFFLEKLSQELDARSLRLNTPAVFVLDLDGFKAINDSLGHPIGDLLLSDVARRLEALAGDGITIARLGGDEFAILQNHVPFTSDAVDLARRLLAAVQEAWDVGSRSLRITASVGIATIEQSAGAIDAAEALRRADAAMYRAKERGKNRFAFYEPALDKAAFTQLEVELGLRGAIEKGDLVLQYQPEVDLLTGEVLGMEALVRWQHPERGLLSPAEFIPIAEKTDLILDIDDWVFQEVCRQTSSWGPLLADNPNFLIGVNLSARQFARPGLPERITAMLDRFHVRPSNLLLEITETATTIEIDAAVSQMRALKARGVRLAIDDFGTGFASLTYLRRFPIDVLKIDRSFIENLDVDPAARTIVRGLTTLAGLLQLSVTAEGIETQAQLHDVVDLGCSRGQGFYLSEPVDAAEATRLIEHGLRGFDGVSPLRLRAAG